MFFLVIRSYRSGSGAFIIEHEFSQGTRQFCFAHTGRTRKIKEPNGRFASCSPPGRRKAFETACRHFLDRLPFRAAGLPYAGFLGLAFQKLRDRDVVQRETIWAISSASTSPSVRCLLGLQFFHSEFPIDRFFPIRAGPISRRPLFPGRLPFGALDLLAGLSIAP